MLSFVIPVRNDGSRLRNCLRSISHDQSAVSSEVIVVDNGSTDDSAEVARHAGAQVLNMPTGRVADLRNRAAQVARGDLLAFVDADHELAPGWPQAAVELLRDTSIAAAGAQYHAPVDGTWVQQMYDRFRRHPSGAEDVDWLPSGNLIVRKAVFDRIGGFDTSLETCEDVDFCQRLIASGGRLLAADRLRSTHRGDPTSLRALFFGELWRGRDNLKVSLRGRLGLRALISIAIPIVNLLALMAMAVGVATWTLGGSWLFAIGALIVSTLIVARAASLLVRSPAAHFRLALIGQALVVAAVYDVARALALVARFSHQARRRA